MVQAIVDAIRERWVVVVLLGILLTVGLVGNRQPPIITDFTARSAGEMVVPYTAAMSPLPAIHADSWGPVTTPTPVPSPRPVRGPDRREAPTRSVPPVPVTGPVSSGPIADQIMAAFGPTYGPRAVRIAQCESKLNPRTTGSAGERGVFQIHLGHYDGRWGGKPRVTFHGYTWAQMYEVGPNIAVAHAMSNGGKNWGAWTCKG